MYSQKKSANARLDYVRLNHKSPSADLKNGKAADALPLPLAPKNSNQKVAKDSRGSSPESHPPGCICIRKAQTLVCTHCKMFSYGRISRNCEWHRNVTYLMDFNNCPNCLGPSDMLRCLNLDFEHYQNLNAALNKKF